MAATDFIEKELARLEAEGLLRPPVGAVPSRTELLDVSSNDYLGLGRSGVSRETLAELEGACAGAGASRLIHGSRPQHEVLEAELAQWLGTEATLLFGSGYLANLGAITSLCRRGDLVVSDALNHASIIDACRLSRAEVRVFPHLDAEAARDALRTSPGGGRRWLVTESYYSMDADSPDLAAYRALCDELGAGLIVDEAHALGVLGPGGAGLCAAAGVQPEALIGTLGKAVGAQGAFVASSRMVRTWLWNRARSLVFTTAPSPLLTGVTRAHLARVRQADSARSRLLEHAAALRQRLRHGGVAVPEDSHGPIVPVLVNGNQEAVHAARALAEQGILTQAIRPPTVPPQAARLRIALHAGLDDDDLERLARALIATCARRG